MLLAVAHEQEPDVYETGLGREEPGQWLRNTVTLQTDHPAVQIQAKKLTQLKAGPTEKAIAVFQYIRSMPFRTISDPTAVTASRVLRAGYGDSHSKGMLFISMLRGLRIPARMRIVDLGPAFLYGILDTDGRCVSHAISEVYLEGRWSRVDAYCVDLKLGLAARARLIGEGRRLGYGVHLNGQVAWDGHHDAFGQFSLSDPSSLPLEDLGVYDDPAQLLACGLAPRMNWAGQARWTISTALVNRRLSALRRSRMRRASS